MEMNIKRRGLGRGLEALLGVNLGDAREPAEQQAEAGPGVSPPESELRLLPVDLIQRGRYQPRTDMRQESLEDLAESIKAQGVVQPIVVRPLEHDSGRYEIIAGERRWRAAQLAGLHEISAIVRRVPDRAALSIALIENIQRENLNALEEAQAFSRLINEFGMTHQDVADAVGRSRAAVTNLLRLLELDEEVKRKVEAGALEMGHARALLALAPAEQRRVGSLVAEGALSVRETERLVRQALETAAPAAPAEAKETRPDPNIARLERELSERLGSNVSFKHKTSGKGQLIIRYNSLEELDGLLTRIK
jgi:ParB family chromosome partitioning protein